MNTFNGVQAKTGDWVCSCGDLNFAIRTSCRKCANPKNSSGSVQVRPGDWSCPVCNHLNFARNQCCRNCNVVPSLASGRNNSSSTRAATTPPAIPGDWSCSCGEYNFARNQSCRKCKSPKSTVPAPSTSSSSSQTTTATNNSAEGNLCVVCMEKPAEIAITVCGHLCLCAPCAQLLHSCPLCRATFTSSNLLKIFVPAGDSSPAPAPAPAPTPAPAPSPAPVPASSTSSSLLQTTSNSVEANNPCVVL